MRLTSENREKIASCAVWITVVVLYFPCWIIEKITATYFPELNDRIGLWADCKLRKLTIRIETWINNTPEKTMELLKKQ